MDLPVHIVEYTRPERRDYRVDGLMAEELETNGTLVVLDRAPDLAD